MLSIIKYIIYFIVLNVILNTIFRFNPIVGYIIYIGFIFYWFRSFRYKTRSFRTYTQADPTPKHKPTGDVIDVEYTEHNEN